jgi:pyruvate-ferredoxin/flavodoxin oxidoreductase
VLPLFRYDPRVEGVFGTRISLDGNPDPDELQGDVSFADWAAGQARFASDADALEQVAAGCLANWQTLQELAGIVTPFTDRLEQDIRAEVAAEHEAALDAQKQEAAAELREVQEKTQAEIAQNIRSRLLQLATRKKD